MTQKNNVKLKLLRTVGFYDHENHPFRHIFFPPLAMGILFAQLKKHGYSVTQDDLSIRLHHSIYGGDGAIGKYGIFFEEPRIINFLNTGSDQELESLIFKTTEGVDLNGIGVFLLSVPETISNPSNILFVLAFSKWLKKNFDSKIIVGGHPFSVMLLVNKYKTGGIIDCIVLEDGEEAIIEALEGIVLGKIDTRKTVFFRKLTDMIVLPDFSGLPMEKYNFSFQKSDRLFNNEVLKDCLSSNMLILPIQFIKGCPNRCAFCGSSSKGLRSYLQPEEVVAGIRRLQEKHNPLGYLFLHDTINFSASYFEKLCDSIRDSGTKILWSDCARVEGLSERLIAKAREAGCIRLILGLETASVSLLGKVKKGISVIEVESALKLAAKYGIWTGIEIICGLPHETEEDIDTTIDFLLRNERYIDRIYSNIFDLRDHSLMWLHPEEYGIENIGEVNLYSEPGSDKCNQCNFVRFKFDEKNGLKWEDKNKQMLHSYRKLTSLTHSKQNFEPNLEEHIIFYLYSKYQDKELVKKYSAAGA